MDCFKDANEVMHVFYSKFLLEMLPFELKPWMPFPFLPAFIHENGGLYFVDAKMNSNSLCTMK